jgi:hypothetical protein
MKKIVFIMIAASFLFADWNWLVSLFKKEVPTLEYTVETSGKNPRVYEFDTQGYPRMHCVVFLRPDTRTSPAMQCVPTNEENIKKNIHLIKGK